MKGNFVIISILKERKIYLDLLTIFEDDFHKIEFKFKQIMENIEEKS